MALQLLHAVVACTLVLVVTGLAQLALRVWVLTRRVEALEAACDAADDEPESVPRLHVVQPSSQPATCSHPPHQRQDASTLRKRQFFCHACRATVPDGE